MVMLFCQLDRRQANTLLQEQTGQFGFNGDPPVPLAVRLAKVSEYKGRGEITSDTQPRCPSALLRGHHRRFP